MVWRGSAPIVRQIDGGRRCLFHQEEPRTVAYLLAETTPHLPPLGIVLLGKSLSPSALRVFEDLQGPSQHT